MTRSDPSLRPLFGTTPRLLGVALGLLLLFGCEDAGDVLFYGHGESVDLGSSDDSGDPVVDTEDDDDDDDDEPCTLTCSATSDSISVGLSCGTGSRSCNYSYDSYGRVSHISCSYSNGTSFSCSVNYDSLGHPGGSCSGEGDTCYF